VRENMFVPQKGVVIDTLSQAIVNNRSGSNVERLYSLFTDTRLSYGKTFNNIHSLSVNTGFRFSDSKMESDYGFGYNSATDEYVTVGQGQAALRSVGGQNGNWRSLNVYGNMDYDLHKKYFWSFNLAADASSRFGSQISSSNQVLINDQPFALLPSASAAWLISSENFLAGNKFIDLLKLRTSFGYVGNDDIGNYTSRQYYLSQNFLGAQGLVRANIANPDLKWEMIEKFNVGLDAGIFNERLNMSIDDMLIQEPINTISGFDYALTNNGGMRTHGLEVGLNGRILNKSLKWDAGLNVSMYRNEITKLPMTRFTSNYAGATILTERGLPSNLFYGYKTDGIYKSNAEAGASNLSVVDGNGTKAAFGGGDVRFIDLNSDQIIDEKDRQVIGNPNPDFVGMFSNKLSYKRFSFDALLTFSVGNDIYNFIRRDLEGMNGLQNQTPIVLNRWRADGQETNVPKVAIGDPSGNSRFSDRWIEDGSYLRLRTISLSYDVPMKTKAFKYTRVYLTGNNLFTFTKYLGYDPEFSASDNVFQQGIDTGLTPQFKTVQLGVRVGL
jgi:TonB-linked SusC/RagA family outer membrane protein